MKSLLASAALLALAAVMTPAAAAQLTVANDSSSVIHHLFVSPAAERNWGADQLGKETIDSKGRFTVRNIPAGKYDIRIVDEDDDACVLKAIDLQMDQTWTLTDQILKTCDDD
jgi:hypothetical protein